MGMNDRMGAGVVGADAVNFFVVKTNIADVSADTSYFVIVPFNAKLARAYVVVDGAVLTADLVLTFKNGANTIGTLTLTQAGSVAGTIGSMTALSGPQFANFNQGTAVEVAVTGAGAGGTPRGALSMIFERLG